MPFQRQVIPTAPVPPRNPSPETDLAHNRKIQDWMNNVKESLEVVGNNNDSGLTTPFVINGTFATTTAINSAMTLGQLNAFVMTMVQAMINSGFISTNIGL